jgi:hypothetical protein
LFQGVSQVIQSVLNDLELAVNKVMELTHGVAAAAHAVDEGAQLLATTLTGSEQAQAAKPYYSDRRQPVLHPFTC